MIRVLKINAVFRLCPTHRVLASEKHGRQHRHHLDCSAMHGGVIHDNTGLLHHLIGVAKAQGVSHIPAHAGPHDCPEDTEAVLGL